MSGSKHQHEVVVVSATNKDTQERLNAYLKLGWVVEKIEPMTAAGGGAGTGWGAYSLVLLKWLYDGEDAPSPA